MLNKIGGYPLQIIRSLVPLVGTAVVLTSKGRLRVIESLCVALKDKVWIGDVVLYL